MDDTIFAVSSGLPPAAIAILRISGARARAAAAALVAPSDLPSPRRARLLTLRDPGSKLVLDRALVLTFDAPNTATGEDVVELHVHGGRAVVAAVEAALAAMSGLRRADPGEFTRRALAHGRIDLAEAEGLGDLLNAETEAQRQAAMGMADGGVSRRVAGWRARAIALSARVEAEIDFSDEDDVAADATLLNSIWREAGALRDEMLEVLAVPTVARLRDGIRVVLAGPPNSGKSTLVNALAQREVAIVSPIAGTTRDRIEISVAHDGLPYVLTDTAGLRAETEDAIERIGIARAEEAVRNADMIVWLGAGAPAEENAIWIRSKADLDDVASDAPLAVSAHTGLGLAELWEAIAARARALVPRAGALAMNERQARHCRAAAEALTDLPYDELLMAEGLRRAIAELSRVTGDSGVEAMLDALFAKFCIGK